MDAPVVPNVAPKAPVGVSPAALVDGPAKLETAEALPPLTADTPPKSSKDTVGGDQKLETRSETASVCAQDADDAMSFESVTPSEFQDEPSISG